jgi:trans-aconitate 2-methyltransferase
MDTAKSPPVVSESSRCQESKTYCWDAEDYAANSSAQFCWGVELMGKLAWWGNERVLDLGCGDGKLSARLAEHAPAGAVTGIDASAQMIALAHARWAKKMQGTKQRLSFVRMDAQALRFESAFDVVFSNAVLHWVSDHPAVMAGVRRALRPGGRLLLQTPGAGNCAQFVEAVDQVRGQPRWRSFFRDFAFPWQFSAVTDYANWLDRAGLETQRIERVHKDMRHSGPEALVGWMRSTWLPYLDRLPGAQRGVFVLEVIDRYLRQVPTDDAGCTHVDMVRLEVAAVRR